MAIVVAIAGYAMRSFRASRDLYAIGSNPEAAALAGVPIGRRVFTAFLISGALAGLGGALFLAEFATVDATGGTGYELLVVSAVVVGGVAIFGGSGTVLGAALGALLLNTINQALGRAASSRRSGTRPSPARCCWPRSPSTAGSACGSPADCSRPRGAP